MLPAPSAPADPRCTCGEVEHRQSCRIERERQQLVAALANFAREKMEERAAGRSAFRSAPMALHWFYAKARRWASPQSPNLEPRGGTRSRPGSGRALWSAIAFAVGLAERELAPAPVSRWLAEHYAAGRSYDSISELGGVSRFEVRQAMASAHRLIRKRLIAGGWIETGPGEE